MESTRQQRKRAGRRTPGIRGAARLAAAARRARFGTLDEPGRVTALIAAAVAAHAALLVFVPWLFVTGPLRTHYRYEDKALWSHALPHAVPLALALALLAFSLRRLSRNRTRGLITLFFVVAVSLQWSLAWLEGRGAERISSTLIDPQYGHSEFVALSAEIEHPLALARDYETISTTDRRFVYSRSKPPGHLLFYACCAKLWRALPVERVCEALADSWRFARRGALTGLAVFETLLFVPLSAIPIFLIARLARSANRWGSGRSLRPGDGGAPLRPALLRDAPSAEPGPDAGSRRAGRGGTGDGDLSGVYASLAFLLLPCYQLVTMHMDQVLYPLLISLALWPAAAALPRRPAWGLLAGVASAAAIFVSFSLLPAFAVAGALWLSYLVWGRREEPRGRARLFSAGAAALGFAAGSAAGLAVLHLALGFDPGAAYARAMRFHAEWRHLPGLMGPVPTARNFVQFGTWIGLPAAVVLVWRLVRVLRKPWRTLDPLEGFTVLYIPLLVAVSVFGHTRNEIGRLWIPLAVPILLPLADELRRLYGGRPAPYAALALASVLLIKNFVDFR